MELSDKGVAFLKREEGFSPKKYRDASGFSIGYGHFIRSNETFEEPISKEKGEELLRQDVAISVSCVLRNIKVPLNQNQFDALVSFTYNVGTGALQRSTLRSKLNRGEYLGAADEFLKWKFSMGQVNSALVARRMRERSLFLSEVPMPVPEEPQEETSAKSLLLRLVNGLTEIFRKGY